MLSLSPSLELVQKAIHAHLSPTVQLASLPRALELLAHVALLADKLQHEITRILDRNLDRNRVDLSEQAVRRLERCRAEVEKTSRRLWQISVDLRLDHIATVLSPGKKVSVKILYLIECYFPAPLIKEGASSSRRTYKSSKLFIRAMPEHIAQEFEDAGRVSREWYTSASESSAISEELFKSLRSKRDNGAVLAKQALACTSRVIEHIRRVDKTLAGDTSTDTSIEVKDEIKSEFRTSRSPSPQRTSKDPRPSTRQKELSNRINATRSITPRVQVPLGSERTTSMAETEALLTISKDEIASSDPIPHGDEIKMAKEHKPVIAPTKPKKRPRPSFPPREGPDYTRPLPHVPSKKLRTFGIGDLKR